MNERQTIHYAGFWIRLVAYLLDSLVLLFILRILFKLTGDPFPAGVISYHLPEELIAIFVSWLYFSLQYASSAQATIGMRIVGIKVVDLDYQRLSLARASGRHFAHYLSAFILFIGFFLIAVTKRKQGLHDYLASTYVIYDRK